MTGVIFVRQFNFSFCYHICDYHYLGYPEPEKGCNYRDKLKLKEDRLFIKIKNFRSVFFWIHFFHKKDSIHTFINTHTVFSQSNKKGVSLYPTLYHLQNHRVVDLL